MQALLSLFIPIIIFTAFTNGSKNDDLEAKLLGCIDLIQELSYPFGESREKDIKLSPSLGVNYKSNSAMIKAFEGMRELLSEDQDLIWQIWMQKVENTILNNTSSKDLYKLFMVGQLLKDLLQTHKDIQDRILLAEIDEWGTIQDFLRLLTRQS